MIKRKTTIEDLARMIAKGFENVDDKMATKEDLSGLKSEFGSLKSEMGGLKSEFGSLRSEMNRHFGLVEERLDNIEKLMLADHKRRIDRLEVEMKELKNALAM